MDMKLGNGRIWMDIDPISIRISVTKFTLGKMASDLIKVYEKSKKFCLRRNFSQEIEQKSLKKLPAAQKVSKNGACDAFSVKNVNILIKNFYLTKNFEFRVLLSFFRFHIFSGFAHH